MSHTTLVAADRAARTAQDWVADVADQFGTDDVELAYRVTRAWLHLVRDNLPVAAAAQFAAQLPVLLCGTFYDSWRLAAVPLHYGRAELVDRFASAAGIAAIDVPKAARAVSGALELHMPDQLHSVLQLLPEQLCDVLCPAEPLVPRD